ncbi:TetR family transcriptional regulator [Leifsonia lichenia]
MISETLGLRERKRHETRAQLERATVLLVAEVGIENATVDAICASVPVSPRTFFNYFESKEDAILGMRDLPIDDAFLAQHRAETAGQSAVEQIVGLLLHVIGPAIGDTELHDARRAIVKEHPELLRRQFAQMTRMGEQLVAGASGLLSHDQAFSAFDAAERASLAELILPFCGGAIRAAVAEWVADGTERDTDELRKRAVELAGKAIQALS